MSEFDEYLKDWEGFNSMANPSSIGNIPNIFTTPNSNHPEFIPAYTVARDNTTIVLRKSKVDFLTELSKLIDIVSVIASINMRVELDGGYIDMPPSITENMTITIHIDNKISSYGKEIHQSIDMGPIVFKEDPISIASVVKQIHELYIEYRKS